MLILLSKLTGDSMDNNSYINSDQIITYGPKISDENKTIIYFTDDRTVITEKSPRDVTNILKDCGVKVYKN